MPNESFSDVIERLLNQEGKNKDITRCIGLWSDIPEEIFNEIKDNNKKIKEQIKERFT